MRFDSGPEVFVRVNRNYVLTEYVLNENDCSLFLTREFVQFSSSKFYCSLFFLPEEDVPSQVVEAKAGENVCDDLLIR